MERSAYLGRAWVLQAGVLGDLIPIDCKSVNTCIRASRAALKEPFARPIRVTLDLELTVAGVFVEANDVEEEQALNRSEIHTVLLIGGVVGGLGAGLWTIALGSNAIVVLFGLDRCVGRLRHCCGFGPTEKRAS